MPLASKDGDVGNGGNDENRDVAADADQEEGRRLGRRR